MSKIISTDLFNLVKTLSRSEKRYCKIKISESGQSNRGRLLAFFDAILKQENYNEQTIFEQKNLSGVKYTSKVKKQLYDSVLKHLRTYHSKTSGEYLLDQALKDVSVMYNRGLHAQCKKMLEKAESYARKHEKHLRIYEICWWKNKIMQSSQYIGYSEKEIGELFKTSQQMLEELKAITNYATLTADMFIAYSRTGGPRTQADIENSDKLSNSPLLKADEKSLSFEARLYLYFSYTFFYRSRGDLKNGYLYREKLVDLLESHPVRIKENIENYIIALNNLVIGQVESGRYREALETLQKFRHITPSSQDLQLKIFISKYLNELDLYIRTGSFKKAIPAIGEIEKKLILLNGKISPGIRFTFYYNIAYVYFGNEDYSKALWWLNKLLNHESQDVREDIHCFARVFNLIIHYELGNQSLLEYIVLSSHRFIYQRKRLYKIESAILLFIRKKLLVIFDPRELAEAFRDLKEDILKITEDAFEKKALEYFDFISWVESKIEKRPFAEIIKEKCAAHGHLR